MTRTIAAAFVFAVLAFALLIAGCKGCSRGTHLAELVAPRGDVKRDTAKTKEKWEAAGAGAKLSLGDGLRTGERSGATVRLSKGGTLSLESQTTIRFLAAAPGNAAAKVSVEAGEATVEADAEPLAIETTIGLARIESGGKLRLSAAENGTRVEVTVGAARLETDDGGVSLTPGRAFEVSLGGAIVEREPPGGADAGKAAPPPPDADAGAGSEIALAVHGAGVRRQGRGGAWEPVAEGAASLVAGDTVDVPLGASVEIRRGARRGRVVGAGRFVIGEEGGALVRATGGSVELEATTEDVVVEVPGGTIVAKAGGKSRVSAEVKTAETKVSVRQGDGAVRGKDASESLRAGEGATLSAKGAVAVTGKSLDRTDFAVRAGESIVVRDPRPPTALGFDLAPACPGAAVVTRGTSSARADHRAGMAIPAGHHEYAVRCIGDEGVATEPAATGTVTVIADAARAELPRLPPSTVVDTDGRRYTVLYQNHLPSVVARWPDAPASKGYALHVDTQRIASDAARKELKPGAIGEGSHQLWFETADGAKKSAETTLAIKFDNAAPAASVSEPADGSFQPGDTVKVAGVVVEGWTVTVNGQAVPLDDQKRFSTTATVPANETALVLRLSHPKRGTVYYVRHAARAR